VATVKKSIGASPGIEPGTSRTRSENHTTRPRGRASESKKCQFLTPWPASGHTLRTRLNCAHASIVSHCPLVVPYSNTSKNKYDAYRARCSTTVQSMSCTAANTLASYRIARWSCRTQIPLKTNTTHIELAAVLPCSPCLVQQQIRDYLYKRILVQRANVVRLSAI
jgi:hypothetical protein